MITIFSAYFNLDSFDNGDTKKAKKLHSKWRSVKNDLLKRALDN